MGNYVLATTTDSDENGPKKPGEPMDIRAYQSFSITTRTTFEQM
jgi:hypothetical protein